MTDNPDTTKLDIDENTEGNNPGDKEEVNQVQDATNLPVNITTKRSRKSSNPFSKHHPPNRSQSRNASLGDSDNTMNGNNRSIPTTLPFPPSSDRPKARHEPGRTTKGTQKLVMFPDTTTAESPPPVISPESPSVSVTHLPEPDQELWESFPLLEEETLRRVTAYLTAESYNLKSLLQHVKKLPGGDMARRYDEVLYTPINFSNVKEPSPPLQGSTLDDLVASEHSVGQVFYFDYGVVVIWGLSEAEEHLVLQSLKPFEHDPLVEEDGEVEAFQFCQSARREHPCLFNDVIMLRSANKLVKLSISHALAQSVKLTYFEELVETTIFKTKDIPYTLAATGSINMPRRSITKFIGELLITRINVNLVSNVLDTPEIFWSQQAWAPLYRVVRTYLEISQRVDLLNQRCMVISDMLDLLREHSNNAHGERLEWIIIVLITIEIILGLLELCLLLTKASK